MNKFLITLRCIISRTGLALILMALFTQSAVHALPPLTQKDLDSIYRTEHLRDEGHIPLECLVPEGSSDGGENAQTVWEFFADKLTAVQIAGIIGNMTVESGVKPQNWEGNPGAVTPAERVGNSPYGWGLVQWTPGSKIIGTFNPISKANDINNQLAFLWDQLNGAYVGNGTLNELSAGDTLKRVEVAANGDPIQAVREATLVFMNKYERPDLTNPNVQRTIPERVASAIGAFERFGELIPTLARAVNHPDDRGAGSAGDGGSGSSAVQVSTYAETCDFSDSKSVVELAQAQLALNGTTFKSEVQNGNSVDFVSWIFKQAQVPFAGGSPEDWRYSSAIALKEFFENTPNYTFIPAGEAEPQPGDVAIFIDPEASIDSAAIVIRTIDDLMYTIMFNDGTRNVDQKNQLIESGLNGLVGFGRAPQLEAVNISGAAPPALNIPGDCTTPAGYVNPDVGRCVGVKDGTQLTPYNSPKEISTPIPITSDISDKIIYGCVDVKANDVTIKNSVIICYDGRDIYYDACLNDPNRPPEDCVPNRNFQAAISATGVTGTEIIQSEIVCGKDRSGSRDSGTAPCDVAIDIKNGVAYNNYIHHAVDGVSPRSNTVIKHNYIFSLVVENERWLADVPNPNLSTGPWSHSDAVQIWDGTSVNVLIEGNFVLSNPEADAVAAGLQGIVTTTKLEQPAVFRSNILMGTHRSARFACWGGPCRMEGNIVDVENKRRGWYAVIGSPGSTYQCTRHSDGSLLNTSDIASYSGGLDNDSCSLPEILLGTLQ